MGERAVTQTDLFGPRILGAADFSPCRTWRYTLWRRWDDSKSFAQFIGLNPSTADETQDDPTVRRCINFAKAWGFGGMCMTNLFGFRATDPRDMKRVADPVGPENDRWLREIAGSAGVVVAAWGCHGTHLSRDRKVLAFLPQVSILALTKDGHPKHPLYLPGDLRPQPLRRVP